MEDYQSFLEGLFICGEADVPAVIGKEKANFIVDVRAEATGSAGGPENKRINIPLEARKPNQSKELKEAIDQLVEAYKKGEKAVLH